MLIIDNHTHLFTKNSSTDYFKKSRAVFALTIVDPDQLYDTTRWKAFVDFLKEEKNTGLIGSIPYEKSLTPTQVQQLLGDMEKRAKDLRIYGVKLYPGYHQFYPYEKSLRVVYEYCMNKHIPVVFHSGDFDDPSGRAKIKYSMPIHVDEVAANFPELKIVISHFGNPWLLETAVILTHKKNVYTDISGFFWEHDPVESAMNFYVTKLKEVISWSGNLSKKLLFGTDYCGEDSPLKYVQPYIDLVKLVFPKDRDQRLIFFENACKVYRLNTV